MQAHDTAGFWPGLTAVSCSALAVLATALQIGRCEQIGQGTCHYTNRAEPAHVLQATPKGTFGPRGKSNSDFAAEEITSHEMPLVFDGRADELLGPLDWAQGCTRASTAEQARYWGRWRSR